MTIHIIYVFDIKKSKFYYNGMDGAVESVIIMLLRDLQRRPCPAVGKRKTNKIKKLQSGE